MGKLPHVLVVCFPAQGHVGPLMKLSHLIADQGIKVTVVNSDFIHSRVVAAMPAGWKESRITLVSIPDGLEPGDERKDIVKVSESTVRFMPGHLKDLIQKINQQSNDDDDDDHITCVIADATTWWAFEVAENLGIKAAAFWPAGLGALAMTLHIPKFIEDGIIDTNGTPLKNDLISMSKEIPGWSNSEIPWNFQGDSNFQKVLFGYTSRIIQAVGLSNWLLCNSFYELDSLSCDLIPGILPLGPLLVGNQAAGSIWPEDSTCLSWLDKQLVGSVIYVAFGSITIFSQQQFDELALGLELIDQPFLWVVRSDITNGSVIEFPNGFTTRISHKGKIVQWAPQEKVLAHPSIACFVSHCGWNSTLEGLSKGVPFLCWPYFVDQFQNKSYICDIWKFGLGLSPDEKGIITRHEIKTKIETLLSDNGLKTNVLKLKEMAEKSVSKGGSSLKNFESFIEQIKH